MSARAAYLRGRLSIGGDLGLSVGVLIISGESLPIVQQSTRAEIGVRFAAHVRYWLVDRVAAMLSFEAVVVPAPFELAVTPTGVVGRLPSAWLSGAVGLAVKID